MLIELAKKIFVLKVRKSRRMSKKRKICLISEEIGGFSASGGIGSAMEELAACLADNNYLVDFLYAPLLHIDEDEIKLIYQRMKQLGVKLILLENNRYVWDGITPEKRSYSVYMHLKNSETSYDVLHFHEFRGLGFFTINAKKQGLDFHKSDVFVQIHGPLRWTIESNNSLFTDPEHLRIDFMEKKCIENADHIICPSAYILSWLKENNYKTPPSENIHVVKNLYRLVSKRKIYIDETECKPAIEFILFARHEDRKGFKYFCDAVDRISDVLADKKIKISFVGGLGTINGKNSGEIITKMALNWRFPIDIKCNLNRHEAISYLKNKDNSVIFIPSPVENLPYAVLEAICLGKPVVTSRDGGASELICKTCHNDLLIKIDSNNISKKMLQAIERGLPNAKASETVEEVEDQWLKLHSAVIDKKSSKSQQNFTKLPKVVLGITHFERPHKLIEAVITGIKQTYKNLEIVVVDDGSQKPETIAALEPINTILKRCGGRLIRRENGYLGAARNTIINNVECDYVVFLDDDDLAFPDMVATLVIAANNTDADVIGCFNIFINETDRNKATSNPENFSQKLNYTPLGGPLSVATFENWLGAATSLIKMSSIKKIGGYSELKNVGFEDYELYVRALQNDLKIEMVPRPLYLYEVGRPSMLSNTSTMRNYRRIVASLDINKNQDAWLDVLNLNTGIKAMKEQLDKINYQYASTGEVSNDFWNADCSKDKYIERLAAYAENIGNLSLASAWRHSLEKNSNLEDEEKNNKTRMYSIREHQLLFKKSDDTENDDLYFKIKNSGILFDIQLKRFREAVQSILSAVDMQNVIDIGLSDIIRVLSVEVDVNEISDDIDELIDKIINIKARNSVRDRVSVSLAVLAMKNKRRELFESLVIGAHEADEKEYFQYYPEVEDAVRNRKILVSGLQHFKRHGFLENRNGFDRMLDLSKVLSKIFSRQVYPWNVGDIFQIEILANASLD